MPTHVKFNSGEFFTVAEDFDQVNQQLGQQDGGLFNRLIGDDRVRVTIITSSIAYIQEVGEDAWDTAVRQALYPEPRD